MTRELVFLCLGCGRTATVKVEHLYPVLKGWVRAYFPPAGWSLLYPPKDYPARTGVCPDCLGKVTERR